jgi:hypothetical protein
MLPPPIRLVIARTGWRLLKSREAREILNWKPRAKPWGFCFPVARPKQTNAPKAIGIFRVPLSGCQTNRFNLLSGPKQQLFHADGNVSGQSERSRSRPSNNGIFREDLSGRESKAKNATHKIIKTSLRLMN